MTQQKREWEKEWKERFGFVIEKIRLNTENPPRNNPAQFSILLEEEMEQFIRTVEDAAEKRGREAEREVVVRILHEMIEELDDSLFMGGERRLLEKVINQLT